MSSLICWRFQRWKWTGAEDPVANHCMYEITFSCVGLDTFSPASVFRSYLTSGSSIMFVCLTWICHIFSCTSKCHEQECYYCSKWPATVKFIYELLDFPYPAESENLSSRWVLTFETNHRMTSVLTNGIFCAYEKSCWAVAKLTKMQTFFALTWKFPSRFISSLWNNEFSYTFDWSC